MFEGIISEVLNNILGTYVDNFDSSKLKLSIWSGNAVLLGLDIKPSAFDDLGLPLRPVYGHLEKLTIKIPWKDLYNSQWVMNIEGLVMLMVPQTSIPYNAEKEEKQQQEEKIATLLQIEEAKKKAQLKETGDSKKEQSGFAEKLTVQVLRNIQITIKDIHIRYEDNLSNQSGPFAAGVTLHDLSLQSTDANWRPCLDTAQLIYKLATLDCLAVYWNPNAQLLSQNVSNREYMKVELKKLIASKDRQLSQMKNILGPINSTAKLQLNPKPEHDGSNFSIPKVVLQLVMDELGLGMSRHQYRDIMALLDSLDRLKLSSLYRKYRPSVSRVSGHAKEWWKYAYKCKLEEIQRRHRNWSWVHMVTHRMLCRDYKTVYKLKLAGKKLSSDQAALEKKCEEKLDVFNITLIRKQAELEVKREGIKREQTQQKQGWFSGWFSWGQTEKVEEGEEAITNLAKKLENAMTDEEKEKMFEAIGYSEGDLTPEYPKEFVAFQFEFILEQLSLIVHDEEVDNAEVTKASLVGVKMSAYQRPAADAFKLKGCIKSFSVNGFKEQGVTPSIISSLQEMGDGEDVNLVDLLVETNPLDDTCDQRVHLRARPLEIVFNANTFNQLGQVFAPPKDISLQQLQSAALNQLEVMKERSVTGLQSVIENHSVLDLQISLEASHVIVPEKGIYTGSSSVIVLNLGSLRVASIPRQDSTNLANLLSQGKSQEEVMEEMRSTSYDHFNIKLTDAQAVIAFRAEDWRSSIASISTTPLHFLKPTALEVNIYKCLITNDPALPKIKIAATLPSLAISVIDERLVQLAYIAQSIPTPQSSATAETKPVEEIDVNMNVITEDVAIARLQNAQLNTTGEQEETPQFTNLALEFQIQEMSVEVCKAVEGLSPVPLLSISVMSLGIDLTQRTFDLSVAVCLGGVLLEYMNGVKKVRLVFTPFVEGADAYLFVLKYTQVNPKCPDFHTKYNSTLQLVKIDITSLTTYLDQGAILSIMAFNDQLMSRLNAQKTSSIKMDEPEEVMDGVKKIGRSESKIEKFTEKNVSTMTKKKKEVEVTDMKVDISLHQVLVYLSLQSQEIAKVDVSGLEVGMMSHQGNTYISTNLKEVTVYDPTPNALHSKIMEIVGTDAWDAQLCLYGDAADEMDPSKVDYSITCTLGCARIVFLNKFINTALAWVDKFQAAKAAIASASAAAAAAAKASLQEAYERSTRVKFNITLRAPLILMPQNSKSMVGLMIDLGKIEILNSFELGSQRNELGHPIIYDKIRMQLHNVKLSRRPMTCRALSTPIGLSCKSLKERINASVELMEASMAVKTESLLLEPVNLDIGIIRNLSIGWYKEHPEVDVKANLKPIKLVLSESDMRSVLQTVQDNLNEGVPDVVKETTAETAVERTPVKEASRSSSVVEQQLAESGHVFQKLCFNFTIESVGLSLYEGDIKPSSEYNEVAACKPLADVMLEIITLKCLIHSDGSMMLNLVLVDCVLQDIRTGNGSGIVCLMERKVTKENKKCGMIDLTYTTSAVKDTFIDFRVSSFKLVLCVPYMLRIQNFFMANMGAEEKPQQLSHQPQQQHSAATSKDVAIKAKSSSKTSASKTSPEKEPLMTVRVKVEKPDIALVEDMTDINTSGIIMHAEISADIRMGKGQQNIYSKLSSLQMYTCCYNPQRRKETLSQILKPCEISFHSSANEVHAEHIDVSVSQIDMYVSPGTIELLSNSLAALGTPEGDKCEEIEKKDWSDLWAVKELRNDMFGFLEAEEAVEALPDIVVEQQSPQHQGLGNEEAVVEMKSILITLEAGVGTTAIPLIKAQAGLMATVKGFKSRVLETSGNMSLEVAYYNPRLALWEPLIEPVEFITEELTEHRPWTVLFELKKELEQIKSGNNSAVMSPASTPDADDIDFEELPEKTPTMSFSLTAKDPLEVTVTKTFMEVQSALSEAFAEAYLRKLKAGHSKRAPYCIKNLTGTDITLALKRSGFQITSRNGPEEVEEIVVESGAEADLTEMKVVVPTHQRVASLVSQYQTAQERTITLQIPSLGARCSIPVTKADKRYFQLTPTDKAQEKLGLVAAITVDNGCKIITLSSCVQVHNHFDVAIDVYYMTERGNEVELVGTLSPHECLCLPLYAIYTPTAELFFCVKGHSVSIVPFVWKMLQNNPNLHQELHCNPKECTNGYGTPFLISATGEMEQIFWGSTQRKTITSALYTIHLRPCVILHNLLPVPLSLTPPGEMTSSVLMPGLALHLTRAQLGLMVLEIQLLNYNGHDWGCTKPLEVNPDELTVWTFETREDSHSGPLTLDLGMHAVRQGGTLTLSLYCPFWMVNKTGLMLTYRKSKKMEKSVANTPETPSTPLKRWASVCTLITSKTKKQRMVDSPNNIVIHEGDSEEVILFSFKSKAFFGKKKASLKVMYSDWSDKFSLDVVGSSGSVTCKEQDRVFQVGVEIQLGGSGLTKIVVFTPYYKICNKSPHDLEVHEVVTPHAEWFTILSGECIGWWPLGSEQSVTVRVRGTSEVTKPVLFDCPHSVLLRLNNKYGGVMCDVTMNEGGVVLTLGECSEGATTTLLINSLPDTTIFFWQQGLQEEQMVLKPRSVMQYTWNSPSGKRELVWDCGKGKTVTHKLDKDDRGSMVDGTLHWAVFLEGPQRCLLFTDELSVASSALCAVELERIQQEFKVSLNKIGFSLVNDIKHKEVMYMGIVSSGVVWEHRKKKGNKYRPFSQKDNELLEKCHTLYQVQLKKFSDLSAVQSHFIITNNLEVDYSTMTLYKPYNRIVRRTFQPGVWIQMNISANQRQLHCKINRLQIDNQTESVIFPVVLAPVAPPKGVMAETVPKPFCEMSMVQHLTSPVFTQYKYLAVLIQEFHVKVELPFVFALMEIFFSEQEQSLYSAEKYEKDAAVIQEDLVSMVSTQVTGGHKDYYDNLHLSPIKMHLSFSLSGLESGSSVPVGGRIIHLFLESVGVTLTEVQDVVFRLAYFERLHQWLGTSQLVQEVMWHYQGQVIKQLYVLVLGLDVIGNPFGLVVGLTKGVEDLFYEPIQGAIEGPGEFVEGMIYGLSSFVGKTLGGAAGAVSRITGTLGQGVAALTLDDDYQRKRREDKIRKPTDGIEAFARGGKGLVTGVFEGVSGVITKPVQGARDEGVEGFFKGVGKGVVGLVTRPASGVIDFASGSFDAVAKATESSEEVTHLRHPRLIQQDGIVRPYDSHAAQGLKLLRELEKGRYAETDVYVAHLQLQGNNRILLATDKRLLYIFKNDLFGNWKVEWVHPYEDIAEAPTLSPRGLRVVLKQEKKKMLGMFGGGDNSKIMSVVKHPKMQVSTTACSVSGLSAPTTLMHAPGTYPSSTLVKEHGRVENLQELVSDGSQRQNKSQKLYRSGRGVSNSEPKATEHKGLFGRPGMTSSVGKRSSKGNGMFGALHGGFQNIGKGMSQGITHISKGVGQGLKIITGNPAAREAVSSDETKGFNEMEEQVLPLTEKYVIPCMDSKFQIMIERIIESYTRAGQL
ncbi:vacuolar protein sorting 13C isoform X3 [Oratosquilla oratoria]|uniref:vacuolar protein sorting 13C isoform X3 n=1 Tax=Oratosquilla oratoria TaxID=337810 RepID=UPI003F75B268